ncbi:uncharacterized protein LOC143291150 [Babylonia areolata]|uniref:uncharacterized protein LOC143291150 n=1 Tax=Babylonia areolata TaxID=304850 RepID=UPI003FD1D6E3
MSRVDFCCKFCLQSSSSICFQFPASVIISHRLPPRPAEDLRKSTMLNKVDNLNLVPTAISTPFTVTSTDRQGGCGVFLVDAMTDAQLSDTFAMICGAGRQGQGFSVDEYADEAEFRAEVESGYRFAVVDKSDGKMVAAFILAVSKYSRGCPVADPFIIVRADQRGRGLGRVCMELCVKLAVRLHFMGMYVDTFSNNTAMLNIIRSVPGMVRVGCLPMGGVMTDGEIVSTLIFYKDLRPDNAIRKG